MSTWKNILTDPPAPGTGIRVTDGKSVFVGRVAGSEIPNHTWFVGIDLGDGSQICIDPEELTEWMPLAAPEREKTADEMLRELGYKKISEKPLCTIYENNEGERIYLKFPGGRYAMNLLVYAANAPGMARELDVKEVLALARLIEEMEAKK